jgi:sulfonate transport system substrate-binding protein
MKKIWALLALLAVGIGARAADPGWPEVVRLGIVGNAYNKPFTSGTVGLIQDSQSFDKALAAHGTKVEWNFFLNTGPAINEAVANGTIDIAGSGDLPSVIGRAGGLKTKLLAGTGRESIIYIGVLTGSPIRTLDDLKGKRVTFQKGTYLDLAFARLIKDRGETEDDYKVYSLVGLDQTTALQAGSVDAVVGGTSLLTLHKQGTVRIIYKTSPFDASAKYLGYGNEYATEDFIKKYPQVVQLFIDQYVEASVRLSQPDFRQEYFSLLAKTGATSSEAREDLGTEPVAGRINPLLGPKWLEHVNASIQEIKDFGFIRKTFDVNDWLDRSFLDKAVEKAGPLPKEWDPS